MNRKAKRGPPRSGLVQPLVSTPFDFAVRSHKARSTLFLHRLSAWPSNSGCHFRFFPSASGRPQRSATNFTRLSDMWVLRRSTTKIHSPSGSVSTVRSMCATNSGSVRVASRVGQTIVPVTTSRPAVIFLRCGLKTTSLWSRSTSPHVSTSVEALIRMVESTKGGSPQFLFALCTFVISRSSGSLVRSTTLG